MEAIKNIKEKMLKLLSNNIDRSLSQKMMAKELKISSGCCSKYVGILAAEGKVKVENLGSTNVVRLK